MIVRPAVRQDAAGIYDIEKESFSVPWSRDSIDHELEDAIIGDEMYYRLLNHFEQALEMKHY